MKTVVTISGPARHGKTTSAEYLKKILELKGHRVMLLSFGDYLKLIAKQCFGYKGDDYKSDPEQRSLLQRVGTDIGRKYNESFWANVTKETIIAFQDEFDIAIISDARFPNECDMLKDIYEVINLKVIRRNFDNQLTHENKQHASENGLKFYTFDYYIDSETISELEDKLVMFAEKFLPIRPTVTAAEEGSASKKGKK